MRRFVFLFALPLVAFAQPPGLNGEAEGSRHHDHKLERLTEQVSLDDAQIEQIREVLEVTSEDMRDARKDLEAAVTALRSAREGGDERALSKALKEAEQARESLHVMRKASEDEIKTLLTLEQRALLFEMEMDRRHRDGDARKRPPIRERGPRSERDPESRKAFDDL